LRERHPEPTLLAAMLSSQPAAAADHEPRDARREALARVQAASRAIVSSAALRGALATISSMPYSPPARPA
jgi:hypothetical protein